MVPYSWQHGGPISASDSRGGRSDRHPDPTLGERAKAVAVLKPGKRLTLKELLTFLREYHIANYKLPESLLIVEGCHGIPLVRSRKRKLRDLSKMQE